MPAHAEPSNRSSARYPLSVDGGAWKTSHVQGVAVDRQRGYVYFSFTTLLVKTNLKGEVLGTLGGFTGHLGDLDFNEADGRVYGSLEYKEQKAFYIAVIDGEKIDRTEMQAQGSDIFQTVHLAEVVNDYTADMNGDGVFDGNTGDTADHRYGCSGIDGVSFGPRFGETGGTSLLTVAYGIYGNTKRADNDHQVLLQYDASDWVARYARPLVEAAPHRSGPEKVDGKYFLYTGNTTYGVQNLEYDEAGKRWLMGVYAGKKPSFPNYTMFAVEAGAKPVSEKLAGSGESGLLLPLAPEGLRDDASRVRGWFQKADVGIVSLGDGLFYLAVNGTKDGKQTGKLELNRWVGGEKGFEKVAVE
ncbi:hypothetical protein [Luteolibacter soli]|uniref:Uncharacterized protein n=1 Tax=Luteolibacter soli TaxID=3135280 RepID=A0ABU9AX87_9BACT